MKRIRSARYGSKSKKTRVFRASGIIITIVNHVHRRVFTVTARRVNHYQDLISVTGGTLLEASRSVREKSSVLRAKAYAGLLV